MTRRAVRETQRASRDSQLIVVALQLFGERWHQLILRFDI
jgi:hypothetical protein